MNTGLRGCRLVLVLRQTYIELHTPYIENYYMKLLRESVRQIHETITSDKDTRQAHGIPLPV